MHPLKAGMKKATPKYEGPYRVLQRFANGLVVAFWQQIPEQVTHRLYHQPKDRIPLKTRLVHPNNVKPYTSPVVRSPIYDAQLAKTFLKSLGVKPPEGSEEFEPLWGSDEDTTEVVESEDLTTPRTVSYTHLTLPTIYSV